jgi:hypothetical protein
MGPRPPGAVDAGGGRVSGLGRRAAWALIVTAAIGGCAPAPHRYRWQPPGPIAAEHFRACHARADQVAQRRYDRYTDILELAGPFGGQFGGVTLGERAQEEREDFYEWEMKDCLRQLGYQV